MCDPYLYHGVQLNHHGFFKATNSICGTETIDVVSEFSVIQRWRPQWTSIQSEKTLLAGYGTLGSLIRSPSHLSLSRFGYCC
jgi:hypothetical protein